MQATNGIYFRDNHRIGGFLGNGQIMFFIPWWNQSTIINSIAYLSHGLLIAEKSHRPGNNRYNTKGNNKIFFCLLIACFLVHLLVQCYHTTIIVHSIGYIHTHQYDNVICQFSCIRMHVQLESEKIELRFYAPPNTFNHQYNTNTHWIDMCNDISRI